MFDVQRFALVTLALSLFAKRNSLLPNAPLAEYDWPGIRMAHAQFETIHPFPDGSGRLATLGIARESTGRNYGRIVVVQIGIAQIHR